MFHLHRHVIIIHHIQPQTTTVSLIQLVIGQQLAVLKSISLYVSQIIS